MTPNYIHIADDGKCCSVDEDGSLDEDQCDITPFVVRTRGRENTMNDKRKISDDDTDITGQCDDTNMGSSLQEDNIEKKQIKRVKLSTPAVMHDSTMRVSRLTRSTAKKSGLKLNQLGQII